MYNLRIAATFLGMLAVLTACGGFSEDDAIQDVRDRAQTDFFGNMSDPELIHALHEKCSTIESDGMTGLSNEWVGFVFSGANVEEMRPDYILATGNAIKAYCPKYQADFDEYRDGEWRDAFERIENGTY